MTRPARNTTTRDRHRNALKRTKPPCSLCGGEIDYTLPHLDPGEFVVDHIVPLALGGTDELDNKQPAHRHCNAIKAAKLDEPQTTHPPRQFVTDRTW